MVKVQGVERDTVISLGSKLNIYLALSYILTFSIFTGKVTQQTKLKQLAIVIISQLQYNQPELTYPRKNTISVVQTTKGGQKIVQVHPSK